MKMNFVLLKAIGMQWSTTKKFKWAQSLLFGMYKKSRCIFSSSCPRFLSTIHTMYEIALAYRSLHPIQSSIITLYRV
jgi:hypothetical protein